MTALASLGEIIAPESLREVPPPDNLLPYIGMENVATNSGRILGFSDSTVIKSSSPLVQKGDVLYGRLRPYLNKVTVSPVDAYVSGEFIVFRGNERITAPYLRWLLTSHEFVEFATALNSGDRPRVKWSQIQSFRLRLPPVGEQRRIVDILEDHLSRLDVGDALLRNAEVRLDSLLASSLSRLDPGESVELGAVAAIQSGIQKQPKRTPRDNVRPFLRVANVTRDGLNLADIHYVQVVEGDDERYGLAAGDLLVVEGNGSASQIGRGAMWDASIPRAVHQNHLIRVRPRAGLLPAYLELIWNGPSIRETLSRVASSSSGLHTLSVSKLARLQIPVPPVPVQAQVVARLTELKAWTIRTKRAETSALARSAALRRGLLTAAFAGQLTGNSSDSDRIEELADASHDPH